MIPALSGNFHLPTELLPVILFYEGHKINKNQQGLIHSFSLLYSLFREGKTMTGNVFLDERERLSAHHPRTKAFH